MAFRTTLHLSNFSTPRNFIFVHQSLPPPPLLLFSFMAATSPSSYYHVDKTEIHILHLLHSAGDAMSSTRNMIMQLSEVELPHFLHQLPDCDITHVLHTNSSPPGSSDSSTCHSIPDHATSRELYCQHALFVHYFHDELLAQHGISAGIISCPAHAFKKKVFDHLRSVVLNVMAIHHLSTEDADDVKVYKMTDRFVAALAGLTPHAVNHENLPKNFPKNPCAPTKSLILPPYFSLLERLKIALQLRRDRVRALDAGAAPSELGPESLRNSKGLSVNDGLAWCYSNHIKFIQSIDDNFARLPGKLHESSNMNTHLGTNNPPLKKQKQASFLSSKDSSHHLPQPGVSPDGSIPPTSPSPTILINQSALEKDGLGHMPLPEIIDAVGNGGHQRLLNLFSKGHLNRHGDGSVGKSVSPFLLWTMYRCKRTM